MEWRYYEHVITSRTQARNLLWTFDTLRRLSDAERARLSGNSAQRMAGRSKAQLAAETARYVNPGVLWWAIDPASAVLRGLPQQNDGVSAAIDQNKNPSAVPGKRAVVLPG
jgi:hypothetical protein